MYLYFCPITNLLYLTEHPSLKPHACTSTGRSSYFNCRNTMLGWRSAPRKYYLIRLKEPFVPAVGYSRTSFTGSGKYDAIFNLRLFRFRLILTCTILIFAPHITFVGSIFPNLAKNVTCNIYSSISACTHSYITTRPGNAVLVYYNKCSTRDKCIIEIYHVAPTNILPLTTSKVIGKY